MVRQAQSNVIEEYQGFLINCRTDGILILLNHGLKKGKTLDPGLVGP